MCQTQILSQKGASFISHCPDCQMINIWNNNLMLYFTPQQFDSFNDFITNLVFSERSFPFPDGEERVILCTPNRDINFVFTLQEYRELSEAMEEAVYLRQVYQLLNQ